MVSFPSIAMENLKIWLLVAALVAVGVLGATVSHQVQTIAHLEKGLSSPQPASAPITAVGGGRVSNESGGAYGRTAEAPTESTTTELLVIIQGRDRYKAGL